LIEGSEWTEITEVMPSNKELKHGLATALAYGLIPAFAVTQFDGQHAEVQLVSRRPVLCVCRTMPVPATVLLVKLHAKKGYRELYGARLSAPGAEIAKAKQSDIVPADFSQPGKDVWLVRPKEALPPGEYALMIGNENFAIFPFTVSEPSSARPHR
jgi:hypothetical protein